MRKLAGIVAVMLLICVLFFSQWVGATFSELTSENVIAEVSVGLVLVISCFAMTALAICFLAIIWKCLFEVILWPLQMIARFFGGVK